MLLPLKQVYEQQGYVIVPGLIIGPDFTALEAACERAILRTRAGSWPHRRTVGKQFPPFDCDEPDSWGVQHVMHPDLGEPAFARWYTSDALITVIRELLECKEEELQMELFNLLINPVSHEFALRWHRDDIRETASEQEELKALGIWNYGVQWNTALYEDSCLYLVPSSHRNARTVDQRARSMTLDPPKDPLDMPGSTRLILQPGETVFYDSNILHCATYDCNQQRATLHATMGNIRGGSSRARNILQHQLTWMKEERFRQKLTDRGKAMLDRLIDLQKKVGDSIEYSLPN